MGDNILRLLMQIYPGLNIIANFGNAIVSTAYSVTLVANGGVSPYTFTILTSLPSWLSFDGIDTFTGTPTNTDTGPVTIRVQLSDSSRKPAIYRDYTFEVVALPLSISGHIAGGIGGTAAGGSYSSTGGVGGNVFTVTSGTFPTTGGMSTAGAALGNWSSPGPYSWTVQVEDSDGNIATLSDSCTISYTTLTLTGNFVNIYDVGDSVSQDQTIAGGNTPYSKFGSTGLASGSLPGGLAMSVSSSNYNMGGTTSGYGSFTFVTKVASADSQTAVSGSQTVIVGDTLFSSVIALIHLENNVTDQIAGTSWTATGTSFTSGTGKFGNYSLECVTNANAHIISNASGAFAVGTGDYCIEFWAYPVAVTANQCAFDCRLSTNSFFGIAIYLNTSSGGVPKVFDINGALIVGSSALSTLTWHHIVCDRHSGTLRFYIDGTLIGSVADTQSVDFSSMVFGNNVSFVQKAGAYVDELEVTKHSRFSGGSLTVPTRARQDGGI
jgi:hypothetical protein